MESEQKPFDDMFDKSSIFIHVERAEALLVKLLFEIMIDTKSRLAGIPNNLRDSSSQSIFFSLNMLQINRRNIGFLLRILKVWVNQMCILSLNYSQGTSSLGADF